MTTLTPAWKAQYEAQFASMQIPAAKLALGMEAARKIIAHRSDYEAVSQATNGIPWTFIGCLHYREGSLNFGTYLGDGEPLDHATHNVPKGRGPFKTFFDGCVDALRHVGFDKVTDWGLGSQLFHAEEFNGEGYHNHGLPSPYVFAGTTVYSHGMYLSDGKFSYTAIDPRIGVAVILAAIARLLPDLINTGAKTMATATPAPASPILVGVPVATLQKVANVSQKSVIANFSLGGLGSILAFAGPFLAGLFPTQAHLILAVATTVVGAGVAATGFINALHLNAAATAITNGFIGSVVTVAQTVETALGASPTSIAQPAS